MERFVEYYNGVRLHSAIGYIAPLDFMAGKAPEIWSERDRKLEQAADKEFQGSAFPILAREIFEAVRERSALSAGAEQAAGSEPMVGDLPSKAER